MIEIRFHGRGGQGAVTSAEMVAYAAIIEGKYAQAFPSFGPERRGAPVLSFARVSEAPIRIRAGIEEPDVVVVLDPSLMRITNVALGLKEKGVVIANTKRTPQELRPLFPNPTRLAVVDATRIAREFLGVPVTNTTMLGALIKVTGIVDLESLRGPLEKRFGAAAERNIKACLKAFEETVTLEVD